MTSVVYADFTCPRRLPGQPARRRAHRGRPARTGLACGRAQTPAPPHRHPAPAARRSDPRPGAQRGAGTDAPGEELPPRAPGLLPHTAAAVAAYAGAYGAGVADLVRPLLFSAYWVDGMDIGDPEVLRRLLPGAFAKGRRTSDPIRDFGYAVTSQHGPITTAAYRRIRDWQQEWLALGGAVGLTLVTDVATVCGSLALEQLPQAGRPGAGPVPSLPRPYAGTPVLAGQS